MESDWPFKEVPNTATFVTSHVFNGEPICYAYHNWDDGTWQFLPDRVTEQADAMLVCLKEVFKIDHSIGELANLPHGWMAHRENRSAQWIRSKHHPYPVFADDGYYLDDATDYERLYPELYQIPCEHLREALRTGDLVKLIFRFADEWSARKDNQCERMWVEVIAVDEENQNYQGKLLNTPHLHSVIGEGHTLWFHPIHVFAIDGRSLNSSPEEPKE
ncbi:MAG: hypothetical protein U1F71_07795 [Verrucomicrobiaceae bacterium]